VFDSFGKFDNLEYSGIWLIVVVMTLYGMDAAMMAGVIAAISTYVVQSIAYISPIRGSMSAVTLRSSNRNRSSEAEATLNSLLVGRSRILVVQLQGHLFFGNMAHFTEKMHQLLTSKSNGISEEVHHMSPLVVIMDFSLVVSIDSSAAHAISKLKSAIQRKYQVGLCIYVAGSDDGFPTEFNLSEELSATPYAMTKTSESPNETTSLLESLEEVNGADIKSRYSGSHVCESLDSALIFAEDALIAREDFTLLEDDDGGFDASVLIHSNLSASGEREIAIHYLSKLNPKTLEIAELEVLFSLFEREVYQKDQFVWRQDSASDCAKLLVSGSVRALLENEAGTSEMVSKGNLIGELGLVEGDTRMSSVQCISHEAILYSLSRESWEELVRTKPRIARYIDLICIKYLALRVQHVSNRIFETRCLPI
jgi:SulP family sulfate permease